MNKRILITGCSGFIGRHAVSYALKNGYHVVGLDIKPFNKKEKNLTFIRGDINDRKVVDRATKGCDHVLHLAAETAGPEFQYDLYKNYGTNMTGFLNVIESARRNGCKKFTYASSSAVYQKYHGEKGHGESAVINVNTLKTHYGKSKLIDEMIADSYTDSYKLNTVGIRYFNIYGPGEGTKLCPSPVTTFLISKRKNGTITIFGDGRQAKDFTHIDDAIRITFKLIEDEKSAGLYNIGTGIATSFNHIARLINPARIVYTKNPYLDSYIFYLKADTRRLLKRIGKYEFIKVDDGVSRLANAK
jgi:nucleoside-diphosphate-sugar epimerase